MKPWNCSLLQKQRLSLSTDFLFSSHIFGFFNLVPLIYICSHLILLFLDRNSGCCLKSCCVTQNQSLNFYQRLQYWWYFPFFLFRSNSAQNQKLCLGTKWPGHPMGLDYGQESGQTSMENKEEKGLGCHSGPVTREHTGCHGLGRFPLLLPQTAGPYSSFVNHCLLNTELHGTYGTQNGVNHLVLMYLLISGFCKSRLLDSGEEPDKSCFTVLTHSPLKIP